VSVIYDEVWITTMREVEICRYSLKKYERFLRKMEDKYGMNTDDFVKKYGFSEDQTEFSDKDTRKVREENIDFKKWYDIYLAKEKCSQRMRELERFLDK
jgi:hypothetical protein